MGGHELTALVGGRVHTGLSVRALSSLVGARGLTLVGARGLTVVGARGLALIGAIVLARSVRLS